MKKILFLGNSHTYFENLPWLFQAVCMQKGVDVDVFMITFPGVEWNWHLKNLCTIPNIKNNGYDFVVMQQKSHPFDGAEALIEQGMPLYNAVKSANSKPVFTATWSEKINPDGQKIIDDAFLQLHEKCADSLIAKCGTAWHLLRDKMDLYADDGEHQNHKGAYLNACILAKTMFDIDPMTLPKQLFFDNKYIDLSESDFAILQKTATEI